MPEEIKCPKCGKIENISIFEYGVCDIFPELKGIKPCYGCPNCRNVWGYTEIT